MSQVPCWCQTDSLRVLVLVASKVNLACTTSYRKNFDEEQTRNEISVEPAKYKFLVFEEESREQHPCQMLSC